MSAICYYTNNDNYLTMADKADLVGLVLIKRWQTYS